MNFGSPLRCRQSPITGRSFSKLSFDPGSYFIANCARRGAFAVCALRSFLFSAAAERHRYFWRTFGAVQRCVTHQSRPGRYPPVSINFTARDGRWSATTELTVRGMHWSSRQRLTLARHDEQRRNHAA